MNGRSHASSSSGPSQAVVPPRLLQGIAALRARLLDTKDSGELYDDFLEHIVWVPELWPSSHARPHDLLQTVVLTVSNRLRPGFTAQQCSTYEIGDTGFWHGLMVSRSAIAWFFYDDDTRKGLVALHDPLCASGSMFLIRLSLVVPTQEGAPAVVTAVVTAAATEPEPEDTSPTSEGRLLN